MDGDAGQEILGSGVASLGDQSHCTVCTLISCDALVPSLKIDRGLFSDFYLEGNLAPLG